MIIKNEDIKDNYETKSLQVASYLFAKGIELKSTKREDQVIFVFESQPDMESIIDGYFNDAPINALKHWEAIRSLKSRIFKG